MKSNSILNPKSKKKKKEQFLKRLKLIIDYVIAEEFELAQKQIEFIEDHEFEYKEFRQRSFFYQICYLRTFFELERKKIFSFYTDEETNEISISSDLTKDLFQVYETIIQCVETAGDNETMFTLYLKDTSTISWESVDALIAVTGDMYNLTNPQGQIVFLLYKLCCDYILDDYSNRDLITGEIEPKLNYCPEYEFLYQEIVCLKGIIIDHFNISNRNPSNQLTSDLDSFINIITKNL